MPSCPDCGERIKERDYPASPTFGTRCRCPWLDPNAGLDGHPCPMCGSREHLSCGGNDRWIREHPLGGEGKDVIYGQRSRRRS